MYTEYAFEDKKYDVASKYIKSILFDIVNAETSKLADIREKIAEAEESELRNKMIELCNKHESALLNILGVSDQLNNILQSIDSFSRDLRLLENESLAEIVSNYVEQQTSLAREQANINNGDPVTDAEEVQNTVENNVVKAEETATTAQETETSVREVQSFDNDTKNILADFSTVEKMLNVYRNDMYKEVGTLENFMYPDAVTGTPAYENGRIKPESYTKTTPKFRSNTVGAALDEMLSNSLRETYNTRKWLKTFGRFGAGLLGFTVLSQLFFGHSGSKYSEKEKA